MPVTATVTATVTVTVTVTATVTVGVTAVAVTATVTAIINKNEKMQKSRKCDTTSKEKRIEEARGGGHRGEGCTTIEFRQEAVDPLGT